MPLRTLLGFLAAVGAIVLAVAIYFVVVADREAKAALVTERSETVLALQRLEDALARAESAQRGYLLTREERYLDAYQRAIAEIPPALDGVKERVAAGPGRPAPSDALAALVDAKLAELRRGVEIRDADGLGQALRALRDGNALWLTETIEAVRAEMEAVERAALGVQRRAWFGRMALADAVFLAANVVLLALVTAAGFAVRSEMRRREEREQERARMLDLQERIVGIVSHDLRNPLAAIQAGATLLARAGLSPAHARIAALIRSSSGRMERIIRDLLDYTRTRARKGVPLSIRSTDIGEVCARVIEEVALCEGDGAVELRRDGDLSGEWDPDRLQQAIGNLVSNALKYAPPGAPVRIWATGEEGWVRVGVENDGPPIAPELMRTLFDPFQKGGSGAATGGLGLGLFIVRTIVEAHGGAVEVDSGPAKPVTFTMSLPRAGPGSGREATSSAIWRPSRSHVAARAPNGSPGDVPSSR